MSQVPLIDVAHWQERLDTIAKETGVPGAELGILRLHDDGPDELYTFATGVLNANTGRNVTVDSLFQIGSISKTWTGTVIMQLVEEGKISLDQLVKDIIPGFKLITEELTNSVTVRHLLTHTSGIDGDVFVDTGRGDDCLQKYVDEIMPTAIQIHPLGATWSYCNSGFIILGRIIEIITGQVWDAAMKERLFSPLGLTHTVTLPEEALLFDTAVGHVATVPEPAVAPIWMLQRNAGPAGLIVARVADLLAFARLHLKDGAAADGTRVISPESAQAMRAFEADVPEKYLLGDSWGLSFERFNWHGAQVFGHDGNTLGQAGFMRFYPEGNLAVGLLVNEGSGHELYQTIYGEIFNELAGVQIQDLLVLPENPPELDITEWLGSYERAGALIELSLNEAGKPIFRATQKGELAEIEATPVMEFEMIPVREGLYAVWMEDMHLHAPVWLYQLETGGRYIHFGARATQKVS